MHEQLRTRQVPSIRCSWERVACEFVCSSAAQQAQDQRVVIVLAWCNLGLCAGVPSIAQLLASGLWQHVTQPLLLTPLMQPDAAATAAAQQQSLQPQVRPGVTGSNRSGSSLLGSPAGLLSASPNFKGSGWSNGPLAAGQGACGLGAGAAGGRDFWHALFEASIQVWMRAPHRCPEKKNSVCRSVAACWPGCYNSRRKASYSC